METQEQAVEKNAENTPQEKPKKDVKKEILSWILTLAAAVVIALVIRTFLFEPVRVDGNSMNDTLIDGEIMFVTKPEYLLGSPKNGDVIVCRYPDRGRTLFVKRLIGVPGDTIEIIKNAVYVNDVLVDESYLTPERNNNGYSMAKITLGEDEYFVMGDNRNVSHDSRSSDVGRLSRSYIVGHVQGVFFPFSSWRGVK